MAFDLYVKYRERTFKARANEARRRVYVLERRLSRANRPTGSSEVPVEKSGRLSALRHCHRRWPRQPRPHPGRRCRHRHRRSLCGLRDSPRRTELARHPLVARAGAVPHSHGLRAAEVAPVDQGRAGSKALHNAGGAVARMALEILAVSQPVPQYRGRGSRRVRGWSTARPSGSGWRPWLFTGRSLVILLRHLRLFVEPVPRWRYCSKASMASSRSALRCCTSPTLRSWRPCSIYCSGGCAIPRSATFPCSPIISRSSCCSGIAVSGVWMRYFARVDIVAVKQFAIGLAIFAPAAPKGVGAWFYRPPGAGQHARGLLAVQQADAPGRRVSQPHPQPGQQQPRETACEPVELPRQSPHLRRMGRRVPGKNRRRPDCRSRGLNPWRTPSPKSSCRSNYQPAPKDWMDPAVEFRKGTFCYSALAKNLNYLGLPNPREWQPFDKDWKLPPDWKQHHPRRHEGAAGEVPLVPPVHGHLRALRRLRRQVPFLHRVGRSQEHAGDARGADALGLPPLLHRRRTPAGAAGRRPRPDRGRDQGVVLLLLPMHRVPPLLGLLPLRDRHRGDHHDRPRAAESDRLQHQLGAGAGRQLLPHRQPPGRAAARLQGQRGFRRGRTGRADRHPRGRVHQSQGRRGAVHRAFGRLLRHPALLHVPRLPGAVPRDRPGLHLQRLCLRRRQLRPVQLPRDDQAAQRQSLLRKPSGWE